MLPWIQRKEYLENVGRLPEEYPEGSEGHLQWTYNPRTKKSREYFAKTFATLKQQNDSSRKDSVGRRSVRRRRKYNDKESQV